MRRNLALNFQFVKPRRGRYQVNVLIHILIVFFFPLFYFTIIFRLLVSASQDGKLIIWDSYTTNKVQLFNNVQFGHFMCLLLMGFILDSIVIFFKKDSLLFLSPIHTSLLALLFLDGFQISIRFLVLLLFFLCLEVQVCSFLRHTVEYSISLILKILTQTLGDTKCWMYVEMYIESALRC